MTQKKSWRDKFENAVRNSLRVDRIAAESATRSILGAEESSFVAIWNGEKEQNAGGK